MSTTQRVVRKQLAGAEDLLQGVGTVTQTRGTGTYPIHKLDIPIPTYDIAEMQASSAEFMRLYGTDTTYTDYRRNPEGTTGIPSNLGGVWEPVRSSEYLVCGNCASIAALRSIEPTITGQKISVLGYYSDTPLVGGGVFIYDSSDTTTSDDGFLCIVTTGGKRWKRQKGFGVYNLLNAGCKLDGVTDDSDRIIAALGSTPTKGILFGSLAGVAAISKQITIDSKELRDFNVTRTTNTANFILTGTRPKLVNGYITSNALAPSFSSALCGLINLHLSTRAEIERVEVLDSTSGVGVFCSTRADYTTIFKCRMDYVGWPILYNDGGGTASRTVNSIDYSSYSIGVGLTIDSCSLGAADKTTVGDGVEVNCPVNRFTDVTVRNCTILKTNTTSANGIGIGCAECDGISIHNNIIKNIAGTAGAIHVEHSSMTSIAFNKIYDSYKGVGIGNDAYDASVCYNEIVRTNEAIQVLGSSDSVRLLKIQGNKLIDTVSYGLQLAGGVAGADITDNTFKNITTSGLYHITIGQTGALVMTKIDIKRNKFIKDNGVSVNILGKSGTISELHCGENQFYGMSGNEITGFISSVAAVGLSKDHYGPQAASAGMFITTCGSPTGYVIGSTGDLALDIVNGVLYKHNGTAWASVLS